MLTSAARSAGLAAASILANAGLAILLFRLQKRNELSLSHAKKPRSICGIYRKPFTNSRRNALSRMGSSVVCQPLGEVRKADDPLYGNSVHPEGRRWRI